MTEAELRTLIEENWGWALIPTKGGRFVVSMPDGTTKEFAGIEEVEDFIRTVPVQDAQGNVTYYNPDTNAYEATPSTQGAPVVGTATTTAGGTPATPTAGAPFILNPGGADIQPGQVPTGRVATTTAGTSPSPQGEETIQPEPPDWKKFAPQIPWKDIWQEDTRTGEFVVRREYQKVYDRFQQTYGPLAAPTPQQKIATEREARLAAEAKIREERLTAAEREQQRLAQTREGRLTATEQARQERQTRIDEQNQALATAQERRAALQQQLDIARSPGDYLAYFNRLQNQNPTSFTTPTGIPRTLEAGFGGQGGQPTGLPAPQGTLPVPIQPAVSGDLRSFVQLNPGAQTPGFKTTQQEIAELQAERNTLMREDVPDPFAINRIQERLATLGRLQQTEGGGFTGLGTRNTEVAAELQGRQFAAPSTQFQGTPDVEAEVQRRLAQHRKILADNGLPFPNEQLQGLLDFFRKQIQGERGIQGSTTGIPAQQTPFQGDGGQGGGLARTLGRESPFPLFRDLYGTRGVSGIPTRQSLQGVTGIPELSRGAFERLPPSEQELYVGGFELAGVPRQDVYGALNRRPEAPFFRSFR